MTIGNEKSFKANKMLSLQAKSRQDYEKQVFNFKVEFKRVNSKNEYHPSVSIMDGIREVKSVRDFIDLSESSIISLISHKDFHRLNSSSESLNGLFFDFDNGYTIEEFKNTEFAKKYNWIITTSRNHMKVKDSKEACERFHVFIPFQSEIKITDYNRSYIDKVQKHFIKSYVKVGLGLDVDLCAVDLARICFPPFKSSDKIDYDFYEIDFNVSSENIKSEYVIEVCKEYIEKEELDERISNEKFQERLKEIALKKLQLKNNKEEFKSWSDLTDDEKLEIILPDLSVVCNTLSHNERFKVASTIYAIKGENGFEIYKNMFDKFEGTGNERNWKQCQKYGAECESYVGSLLTYARLNNPDLIKQKEYKNKNYQYQNNLKEFLSTYNNDSKLEVITNKETDEVVLRDVAEELKSQKIIEYKREIEQCISKISECETEIIDIDNSSSMEEKSKRQDRKSDLKKEIKNLQKIKQSNETNLFQINKINFDDYRENGVQILQDNKQINMQSKFYETDIEFTGDNYLEFFNSFCMFLLGHNYVVINYRDDKLGTKLMKIFEALTEFSCYKVIEKDKKGRVSEKNAFSLWLDNSNRSIVTNLKFDPQHVDEKDTQNLCKKPIVCEKNEEINEEELKIFHEWVYSALCNNNKQTGDYYIEMLRAIYQFKQTGIIMQIMGVEGSGKSTNGELARMIINQRYFLSTSDDSFLTTQFNAPLKHKLLAILEEAIFQADYKSISKLKDYSTKPTIEIIEKGKDSIMYQNHTNFIMISNSDIITKISKTDRRLFIIKTNDEYAKMIDGKVNKKAVQFFDKFYDFLQNKKGASKIYNYLMKKEANVEWLQQNIPESAKKQDILKQSIENQEEFLLECYNQNMCYVVRDIRKKNEDVIYDITDISKSQLYALYQHYSDTHRVKYPKTFYQFGAFLKEFTTNQNKTKRENGVKISIYDFDVKKIESYFEKLGLIESNNSPLPPTGTDGTDGSKTDSIECLFDTIESKIEVKQVSNSNKNTSKINGVTVEFEAKVNKLKQKDFTIDEIADMLSCDVKAVEFVLNKGVKPLVVQQEVTPVVKSDVINVVEQKSNLRVEITPVVEPKSCIDKISQEVKTKIIDKFQQGRDTNTIQYSLSKIDVIISEDEIDKVINDYLIQEDIIEKVEQEVEQEDFTGVVITFVDTDFSFYCVDKKLYEHYEMMNERCVENLKFTFISEDEYYQTV